MILVFNVFLGPETRWFEYDRGNLGRYPKTDILLATLKSYQPLGFTHLFVNIEFGPGYNKPEDFDLEIEEVLNGFGCPYDYSTQQVKTQAAWQDLVRRVISKTPRDNYPIWIAGNHDHPFIGDLEIVEQMKTLFDRDPLVSVIYSHWAEFIDQALLFGGELDPRGFVSYPCEDVHSIRVLTPYLFQSMWFDHDYGDTELPRSDWWVGGGPWDGGHIIVKSPRYRSYVPLREMCRHFDGYSHIGLGPESPQPPLTLPLKPCLVDPRLAINCVAALRGAQVPEDWMKWLRRP